MVKTNSILNWYWLLISWHFLSPKHKFYFNIDKSKRLRPWTLLGTPVPQTRCYVPNRGDRSTPKEDLKYVRFQPWTKIDINKKDGYRQQNVRQFLQSAQGTLFGYITGVTPVCRCLQSLRVLAFWLRQESLWHILASPGYASGTVAVNVNVTWIEREFNACQTHRSMYPSIFNRFPVIQPESSKVRHFSTFFCTFWPPLGTLLGQSR